MKTFSRKKTMAALLLAAATVGLPTTSFADPAKSSYRYQDCKEADREGQLIGGLVGAVAGGVAGREIAGRGDRTEGAAIGAAIGAVAGASIADKDCGDRNRRRTYTNNNHRTYGYNSNRNYGGTVYNTGHRHGPNPRGVARGNPHVHGHTNRDRNWGFQQNSHVCSSGETRRQHVEWEIRELRRERNYLVDKRRYVRYDRNLDRRIYRIGEKLEDLKRELKYLKKNRNYRDYDSRYDRDRYRDYRRDNYYYKTKQ